MTDYSQASATPRWKTWSVWALQILLAFAFLAAGAQKLLGTQAMVDMFTQIGLGQWFRWLTGLLEVGAAIMLLVPVTAFFGAILVVCIMVGAVFTHLAVIGGSAVPAVILLCLAGAVAWLRRPS